MPKNDRRFRTLFFRVSGRYTTFAAEINQQTVRNVFPPAPIPFLFSASLSIYISSACQQAGESPPDFLHPLKRAGELQSAQESLTAFSGGTCRSNVPPQGATRLYLFCCNLFSRHCTHPVRAFPYRCGEVCPRPSQRTRRLRMGTRTCQVHPTRGFHTPVAQDTGGASVPYPRLCRQVGRQRTPTAVRPAAATRLQRTLYPRFRYADERRFMVGRQV